MILLIDNYDSFSYNLYQLVGSIEPDIKVIRNDAMTVSEIEKMNPDGIIISPGPGRPEDSGICPEVIEKLGCKIPILGVCLGHQVLGICAGAHVEKGAVPMHGQVTKLYHHGTGLFAGLPSCFDVTRYHSLIIRKETLPADYQIDAYSDDGEIMAISHKTLPIYGVQFHPEAVMTQYGKDILRTFCQIAERRPARCAS